MKEAWSSREENERLWACDRRRSDGKWGKKFLVASVLAFYSKVMSGTIGYGWYEIISKHHRCRFHLDIEIETFDRNKFDTEISRTFMKERLRFCGLPEDHLVSTY